MVTKAEKPLDEKTVRTIKATVPVLAEHGGTIAGVFYRNLFQEHPELRNVFNQTHQKVGEQPKALANAVYMAAAHIDELETILPMVKQVAEKHRSLHVKPEHYPIVGEHLLGAIKEVLGDGATEEVLGAWERAYGVIASVFIDIESDLYEQAENQRGGWSGYRTFRIAEKVKESDTITSFYLQPVDGGALPQFRAGQYVTIKADIPDQPVSHLRQYSLSDAPGNDYFRISVKKERGEDRRPNGIVSCWLHDKVEAGDTLPVSAPAGDFTLDEEVERPLVLISGGVGVTPLMSMWKDAVQRQKNREVHVIHGAKNGAVHAFRDDMTALPAASTHIVYSEPRAEEGTFDQSGYVDRAFLQEKVPSGASVYICGPEGFMTAVHEALAAIGVKHEQIHYEFFGTKGVLEV
ncbi:NO-inducible flavohemoprotein [Halobacillus sp. BAB-2008]|uniref:NO-inducible flavohemoprotein n=1 Tax=Halobacillus sp. BAB-2008 TaxID=1246484 RepID=UPI0002A5139D|nr:NO-inducible flavohemoprotein [Halobacillus sp. BAB-2008]ELK46469.1 bifunctional nitric oxide dioxygenase/dihydropteridine reductase 2 [Halobacillus sp. BAB-2008]